MIIHQIETGPIADEPRNPSMKLHMFSFFVVTVKLTGYKHIVQDYIESLAKAQVNDIYSSPFIHKSSYLMIKGNRVLLAWFALGKWMPTDSRHLHLLRKPRNVFQERLIAWFSQGLKIWKFRIGDILSLFSNFSMRLHMPRLPGVFCLLVLVGWLVGFCSPKKYLNIP